MSIAALDSMSTFVKPEVHIFKTSFLKIMWRYDVYEMPTRLYRPRRVHFMGQLEKSIPIREGNCAFLHTGFLQCVTLESYQS